MLFLFRELGTGKTHGRARTCKGTQTDQRYRHTVYSTTTRQQTLALRARIKKNTDESVGRGATLAATSSAFGGRQAKNPHGVADSELKKKRAGGCGGRGRSSDRTGRPRSGCKRRRWTTTTRGTTAVGRACGGALMPFVKSTPAAGCCFYAHPHITNETLPNRRNNASERQDRSLHNQQ